MANRQLNGVELVLQASWHTEANAPVGAVQCSEAIRPGWVNNTFCPHFHAFRRITGWELAWVPIYILTFFKRKKVTVIAHLLPLNAGPPLESNSLSGQQKTHNSGYAKTDSLVTVMWSDKRKRRGRCLDEESRAHTLGSHTFQKDSHRTSI